MIDDDRPGEYGHFYSDVGYFTRGRSGFRKDPAVNDEINARWAFGAVIVIVSLFAIVRCLLPTVH